MEGEQPHLGDLPTMVINHLLFGMILQVLFFKRHSESQGKIQKSSSPPRVMSWCRFIYVNQGYMAYIKTRCLRSIWQVDCLPEIIGILIVCATFGEIRIVPVHTFLRFSWIGGMPWKMLGLSSTCYWYSSWWLGWRNADWNFLCQESGES